MFTELALADTGEGDTPGLFAHPLPPSVLLLLLTDGKARTPPPKSAADWFQEFSVWAHKSIDHAEALQAITSLADCLLLAAKGHMKFAMATSAGERAHFVHSCAVILLCVWPPSQRSTRFPPTAALTSARWGSNSAAESSD
jgi:hypothetical protein